MLTGGIIPDLYTACFGMLVLFLIYIGIDLIATKTLGVGLGTQLEYLKYRNNLEKKEYFRRRYEKEKFF